MRYSTTVGKRADFACCSRLMGTQKDGVPADTCMTLCLQEKIADPKCSWGEEMFLSQENEGKKWRL